MFEYTCPKCQNTSTTTTVNGAVTPCATCGQRLCVMPDPAAPAGPPPRSWGTPLLALSSGLAGLVVAAGIMLMWYFVGRGLVAGGRAVAVVPKPVGGAPEAPKAPVKDAPPKDPVKDAPSKDPSKDAPPKDTGMGDVPPKDTGMGDVPPKDPSKDAPPKDTGMGDVPKKPTDDKSPPPPPPLISLPDPNELTTTVTFTPPVDPDILAEGPEEIVVTLEGPDQTIVEEKGTLCCLKKSTLWYRKDENYKLVKIAAKDGRVKSVDTVDKKYHWDWDPDLREFTRPVTGPVRKIDPIVLWTRPPVPVDEKAFLFAAIEQLHKELEGTGLDADDLDAIKETALKYWSAAEADLPASSASTVGLLVSTQGQGPLVAASVLLPERTDTNLAGLCRDVVNLVQKWKERDARIAESLSKLKRDAKDLMLRYREAQMEQVVDGFKDIDPDSPDAFILSLLYVGARAQSENALLAGLAQLESDKLGQKALGEIKDARKDYQDEVEAQWRRLCDVGAKDFGRPPFAAVENDRKLLASLREKNDRDGVGKFFADTAGQEQNNPFRISEHCFAAALVRGDKAKRREKVEEVRRLAEKCAWAVRLVPRAAVYDRARLMILNDASILACYAADIELEGEGWGGTYSPAAAYAVRLIDACESYNQYFELSGDRRERRAWALAQSDRLDEAIAQAARVQDLREDLSEYGLNLARLYSYRYDRNHPQDVKDAIHWLERGVRSAASLNVVEMKRNPDLANMRRVKADVFNQLTKVDVRGSRRPAAPQTDVEVTNYSDFAVTNVVVTLNVVIPIKGGLAVQPRTVPAPQVIPRIRPGETMVVSGILKDLPGGWIASVNKFVEAECDQKPK